jgi:hypothetical protein
MFLKRLWKGDFFMLLKRLWNLPAEVSFFSTALKSASGFSLAFLGRALSGLTFLALYFFERPKALATV